MAICKFFIKGYCRYGNSCRFEHPNNNEQRNRDSRGDSYHGYYNNNANDQNKSFSFVNALAQKDTSSPFGYQQQQQQQPFHHSYQQSQPAQHSSVFWSPSASQQPRNASGFSFTQTLASIQGGSSFMPGLTNTGTFNQNHHPFGAPSQTHHPFGAPTRSYQNGQIDIDMVQEFQSADQSNHDSSNNASIPSNQLNHSESNSQAASSSQMNSQSIYSEESDLFQEEKEAYLAKEFSFGSIPIRPPTKAMCS